MPEWKKGDQPKRGEATNSQRMFKVLEVLKKYSDSNNRLTQEQILKLLAGDKDIDFSCNIKTLRQTLTDLNCGIYVVVSCTALPVNNN